MHGLPLASDPLGFFGALVIIIIMLSFFGVFIAVTFGPIALVIAAIVKAFRNSGQSTPATNSTGMSITMPSGTRVIAVDPGSSFAQAFGVSLTRGLGGQLGQSLAQLMTLAAEQHPLELQLAPIVMAVEAARRQGNAAQVRPFLTDQFAARFSSQAAGGQGGSLGAISHVELANQAGLAAEDHVVIRIDRGTIGAVHSEYWSFQRDVSAVPDGTPVVCLRCGAPTAEDHAGTCRFCGATFSTKAPALPQPTRWLLDDISNVPPAVAA